MNTMIRVLLTSVLSLSLIGCGEEPAPSNDPGNQTSEVALPTDLFADAAPDGAIRVRAALHDGSDAQQVTIRGVVGGRKNVFIDSRAIFVVVDEELEYCAGDHGCPTPWDYCCEDPDHLQSHSISVQVSDDQGAPLALSLKGENGLKPLSTVVVQGTLRSLGDGFALDADRIFVEGD